jgi:UDP-3-O-[3-hydroxymyristoyl] N-acetylglucosamine deacetylase
MVLKPAPVGSGIVFERTDLDLEDSIIPAHRDYVHSTDLSTKLVNEQGASIATVEHVMAALAGLGIDDLHIEIDGPEVPAMDGSSIDFVNLINQAGILATPAPRRYIQVLKPVEVVDGLKAAMFLPSLRPAIDIEIDFEEELIGCQNFAFEVLPGVFEAEVAAARTFGFRRDLSMLLNAGLAQGASMDNAVVIDEGRVENDTGLRFENEFVRHKALDALGDIYLAGAPILGLYRATRAGHGLNAKALAALLADTSVWRWTTISEGQITPVRTARS